MPDDAIVMDQGDTLPELQVTLTDDAGNPVLLPAGSTVTIRALKLDQATLAWEHPANIDDQELSQGGVSYPWQAADTADPFEGYLRFHVVFPDASAKTYPDAPGLPFTVTGVGSTDPWVIDFDRIAPRLGLTVPMSGPDRSKVASIVASVQDDVETYLNRPITVQRFTEVIRNDQRDRDGWWTEHDPVVNVIEAVDLNNGWTQLTYTAGYDGRRIPAIRRYVTEHSVIQWRESPWGKRRIRRTGVEGQSLEYESYKEAGQPGGPPTLGSLSAYVRREVFSRPRYSAAPPSGYPVSAALAGADAGTYVVPGGEGSDIFEGDATGQQWPGGW